MDKKIRLSIPKPCSEQWDSFRLSSKGGYCNSCERTVIDFSKMSDKEIVNYFQNHQSGKTCGRFNSIQLGEIGINNSKNKTFASKYASVGIFGMSLLFANSESQAKNPDSIVEINEIEKGDLASTTRATISRIIRGTVFDESGEGLPGVNVVLKGTMVGTTTDLDGKFMFPIELKDGDVLIFASVGMETEEYQISSKDSVEISLRINLDFAMMGEVQVEGLYAERQSILKRMWQGLFGS